MAYQTIDIPGRKPADSIKVSMEPEREPEEKPTKQVQIEAEKEEPDVKEPLEVSLDDDSDDDETTATTEEPKDEKPKRKPGRPKGSTNKKRDKRIQQLLEARDKEAKKAAEMEAKLEALEKRMYESTKASTTSRKTTLEQTLQSLQAQLKNAIEEDDAAAIVEIQDKMMKTNMEYAAVNYELENTPEEYVAPQKQQKKPEASPYALEWIDDHPEFKKDEEFHAAALGANAKLLKEGYDPESEEFYIELDKRLSKRYPEYFDTSDSDVLEYKGEVDDSDDDDDDTPQQTVAGASRTPSGSTSGKQSGRKRKNTVILTQEDQILCQKWGLDPVAFAKRKKSMEGKERGDYVDIN